MPLDPRTSHGTHYDHRRRRPTADLTRSMAQRAGATITEVSGSHVVMVSQPDAVTEVIVEAVEATSLVAVR